MVRVKVSKTDQFRRSTTIQVAATRTSTCPVQAMGRYMKRTSRQFAYKPLFILKGGHCLTRSHFISVVHNQLAMAGYTEEAARAFSSHSFRIRAATESAAAGIPEWLIQVTGRWKSGAYKTYIRPSKKTLQSVAPRMAAGRKAQNTRR